MTRIGQTTSGSFVTSLPKSYIQKLGWRKGTQVKIVLTSKGLILTKL